MSEEKNSAKRTSNGVLVVDPKRDDKSLIDWTVAELCALYSGEIQFDVDPQSEVFEAALRAKVLMKFQDGARWSVTEMYDWLGTGREPERTPSGNFLDDPERFTKDVHKLNDSELVDFGLGYFGDFERSREYVLIEALDRFGLPLGTTFADFSEYCKNGTKPEVTKSGVLLNDRTRAERDAIDWSDEEVLAWAGGVIEYAGSDTNVLLKRAIDQVGGDWYWIRADLTRYLTADEIPDPESVDISSWSFADAKSIIRETGSVALTDKWIEAQERKPLSPGASQYNLPLQWTIEECRSYLLKGDIPDFWEGFWVNDVTRTERELSEKELKGCYASNLVVDQAFLTEALELFYAKLVKEDPEQFSRLTLSDAFAFRFLDRKPKTADGVELVNDVVRDQLPVNEWTDHQLRLLFNDQINTTQAFDKDAIIDECTKSWAEFADYEQRFTWFMENEGPVYTENGVLVTDPRRDTESVRNWTDEELIAYIHGWITIEHEQEDASVLSELFERKLIKSSSWTMDQAIRYITVAIEPEVPSAPDIIYNDDVKLTDLIDLDIPYVKALWDLPKDSTEEEVINAYNELEADGALTTTGALIHDPRRELKAASLWTVEELRGYARNEIPVSKAVTVTTLANAMRRKFPEVDMRWDDVSVKAFVAHRTAPAVTSNGVLVVDLVRDKKWPSDWTDEDLISFMAGEIRTPARRPDVMIACRSRFKISNKYSDQDMIKFILTGEEKEVAVEKPFTSALAATDEQLKAFLKGVFTVTDTLSDDAYMELRRRFKINPHWTDEAIKTWFNEGSEPNKTSNGLFVNDRLRDLECCKKWSLSELEAIAQGEINVLNVATRGQVFQDHARKTITTNTGLVTTAWSVNEILNYLRTGEKPVALAGGVFVNDPTRVNKDALAWSNDELKAWLREEISATEAAPEDDLWRIVYLRFQVPAPWYHGDARSYVLKGIKVPATPSGIWIRDRERDLRPAYMWTRAEIKAWCRGQILAGLASSDEELLRQAITCFNLNDRLSPEFIKAKIAAITEDTTPMTVAFVREDLLSFATGMKVEGAIEAKAAMYQQLLNRCIARVCKLRGQDFVDGWTELLKFYYNQRELLFTPGKIYNGVSMMSITTKQQKHFQYITTVLYSTCNPETREAAIKRIDWNLSLAGIADEESRHQILAFYNVG